MGNVAIIAYGRDIEDSHSTCGYRMIFIYYIILYIIISVWVCFFISATTLKKTHRAGKKGIGTSAIFGLPWLPCTGAWHQAEGFDSHRRHRPWGISGPSDSPNPWNHAVLNGGAMRWCHVPATCTWLWYNRWYSITKSPSKKKHPNQQPMLHCTCVPNHLGCWAFLGPPN